MAFVPIKMDEAQIAFLANEMTKTYMTGKNMGSSEEFAREYFQVYQKSMRIIAEEQTKQQSTTQSLQSFMDEVASEERSSAASMFK